jgi:hypothetical protein
VIVSRRALVALFICSWVFIGSSYAWNLFGATTFKTVDEALDDGETLVAQTLYTRIDGGDAARGGFFVMLPRVIPVGERSYAPTPTVLPDKKGRLAYLSQVALHAQILGAVAPRDSADVAPFLARTQTVIAFLAAAVLSLWVGFVGYRAGMLAAICTAVATAFSPWLIAFARGIYWQVWLFFVPIVAVAFVMRRPNSSIWRAAATAGLLIFLKGSFTYEFLTTIAIGCAVPVVFMDVSAGLRPRTILTRAAITVAAGCVGIVLAIGAHLVKLQLLTNSWIAAWRVVHERFVMRSHGTNYVGFSYPTDGRFREFLASHVPGCGVDCQNLGLMARYLTLPAIGIPGTGWGVPIGLVFFAGVIVAVRRWRRNRDAVVRAEIAALVTAFVAVASWPVIMYHHMLDNFQYDALVFYLPFLPVLFGFLAMSLPKVRRTARLRMSRVEHPLE